MSLVLDASLTLCWVFEDETNDAADVILDRVMAEGAHVPSLWRLEVANGLQNAIRRQRIGTTYRDAALEKLEALPIMVDTSTEALAWKSTLRLADRFGLTIYDATYLELALRLRLPLATLDGALAAAALQSSLEVLGGRAIAPGGRTSA